MTRIVVLADTHLPRRARELPAAVLAALSETDAIIHLGDFTDPALADRLQRYAPLYAVHGNNDPDELRLRFPDRLAMTIQGHRLALIHGHTGGRTALSAARAVEGADVVLFGHSHRSYCAVEGDRLLFNPGSPTDRRFSSSLSYGILDIGPAVTPAIVEL